jgi:hypothetical protein
MLSKAEVVAQVAKLFCLGVDICRRDPAGQPVGIRVWTDVRFAKVLAEEIAELEQEGLIASPRILIVGPGDEPL